MNKVKDLNVELRNLFHVSGELLGEITIVQNSVTIIISFMQFDSLLSNALTQY